MKKLVFMFVAMAAVSFASCGGNQKANEGSADSDSNNVATVNAPAVADTTYNEAKDTMYVAHDGIIDTIAVAPVTDAPAAE